MQGLRLEVLLNGDKCSVNAHHTEGFRLQLQRKMRNYRGKPRKKGPGPHQNAAKRFLQEMGAKRPIRLSVPRPPLLEATGLGLAEDPTAEGRMRTGR